MGRTASTCQKLTTKHFQLNFDGEYLCLHVEMISTAIRVSVGADPQKNYFVGTVDFHLGGIRNPNWCAVCNNTFSNCLVGHNECLLSTSPASAAEGFQEVERALALLTDGKDLFV